VSACVPAVAANWPFRPREHVRFRQVREDIPMVDFEKAQNSHYFYRMGFVVIDTRIS
jgi:hypothetical protein